MAGIRYWRQAIDRLASTLVGEHDGSSSLPEVLGLSSGEDEMALGHARWIGDLEKMGEFGNRYDDRGRLKLY